MALSVACVGGLEGSIAAFQSAVSENLREWIAADVSLQTSTPPDSEQLAVLDALARKGVLKTLVIDTVAQVTSIRAPDPQPVVAKLIDPSHYPLYGRVRLDPDLPLPALLAGHTVAVVSELLDRLQAKLGETIEVNGIPLRISAILRSEPDQLALPPSALPRILLSRQAVEKTGAFRPGGVYFQRFLFRLPERGAGVEDVAGALEQAFPGRKILDYRQPDPQISTLLRLASRFLQTINLLALLGSCLAVAMGLWSQMQVRLDSLAVLKVMGARSRDLLNIYVLECLCIAAAGSLLGMFGALAVESLTAAVIPRLLGLHGQPILHWSAPVRAALAGLLLGLVVPLPVISQVLRVRPARILRRAMAETGGEPDSSLRRVMALAFVGTAAVLSVGTASWRTGALLTTAGAAGAALLWGAATLTLWVLQQAVLRVETLPLACRYGVQNLFRPGNQSRVALSAMSAAIGLLFAVHLLQSEVVSQLDANLPRSSASLALLNIEPEQREGVRQLLARASAPAWVLPFFPVRILSVDGRNAERESGTSLLRRRWSATQASAGSELPRAIEIVHGSWPGGQASGIPQVALPLVLANEIGAHVASRVEFEAGGEERFTAEVVALDRIGLLDRVRCCVLFNQAVPAPATTVYRGIVAASAAEAARLRLSLYRAFPSILTINSADAARFLMEWLEEVLWTVKCAGALATAAAALFLLISVAATRRWRTHEIGLLRAIGARSRQLIVIYTVEFTCLGLLAAALGGTMAWAVVWFGASGLLDRESSVLPTPAVLLVLFAGSAAVTNLAGWLAAVRLLRQQPLAILREL